MKHLARLHEKEEGLEVARRFLEKSAAGEAVRPGGESRSVLEARLKLGTTWTRVVSEPFLEVRFQVEDVLDVEEATALAENYLEATGLQDFPHVTVCAQDEDATRIGVVACRVRLVDCPEHGLRPTVADPDLEQGARTLRKWEQQADRNAEPATLVDMPVQGWRASIERWRADMQTQFESKTKVHDNLQGEVKVRREFGNAAVGYVVVSGDSYTIAVSERRVHAPSYGEVVRVEFGRQGRAGETRKRNAARGR
jgi:hypothetical protein